MPTNPLPFQLEQQECSEWCWASVAIGIGQFYMDSNCPNQQCQLASNILKVGKDCCDDCDCSPGSFEPCNQPKNLGFVLDRIGHGRDGNDGLPSMKFSEIQKEIDSGHPIAVSIQWQEPAAPGHAIVIYGYSENQNLIIADPKAPPGTVITVPLNNFRYPEVGGSLIGNWRAAFRTLRTGE